MSDQYLSSEAVLSSVIRTGKSNVCKVTAEAIRAFIESRPDTVGAVRIDLVAGESDVGASSGIVVFTAHYDMGEGPVTRELVLRHAPGSETRLFFEYDLGRQFKVQQALQGTGVPAPEPLWLDAEGEYFGVPGYIMAFVAGDIPHTSAFTKGPLVKATVADRQVMLSAVMKSLAAVHNTDYEARGLGDFAMKAEGETPMQKCVNWYWQTWEWAHVADYARLVPVHRWLLDNAPAGGVTLTHGDSSLHNYVFKGTQLVAALDWEMSALGRPETDIALQCVSNELFAAPAGSGLLMPPTQEEWLALYEQAGGKALEHFDYFKKFAVYMVIICVLTLQRNQPEEARVAQRPFNDRLWAALES